MVASTDKLLDRVRKLLALAESPNVHEAAAAAGLAQQLITRHRLQALLEDRELEPGLLDDGRNAPLEVARKLRKWKVVLASGLARANACQAYTAGAARRTEQLCVAGRPDDQAAVAALWSWLVKRLEWLSATHGPGQSRDWHESFRIGAADTIVERLLEVQRSERAALTATSVDTTSLARLDTALASRAAAVDRYADEHLRLRKGRRVTVRMDAMEAGRVAGKQVPLPDDGDV